jgi:hypothetical protein
MVELAATIFVWCFFICITPFTLLILFWVLYGIVKLPVVIVKALIEEERNAKAKAAYEAEARQKSIGSFAFSAGRYMRRLLNEKKTK